MPRGQQQTLNLSDDEAEFFHDLEDGDISARVQVWADQYDWPSGAELTVAASIAPRQANQWTVLGTISAEGATRYDTLEGYTVLKVYVSGAVTGGDYMNIFINSFTY